MIYQVKLLQGDVRDRLRDLPDNNVHMVVTSPPYWSLRDYGVEPVVWGGELECDHKWGEKRLIQKGRNDASRNNIGDGIFGEYGKDNSCPKQFGSQGHRLVKSQKIMA